MPLYSATPLPGLSTLTAAAYGQVVSDVSGTLFGNTIDALAARCGLPGPGLSSAQRQLRSVRMVGMAGAVCGVTLGCLVGMLSLLCMDLEKSERLKRQVRHASAHAPCPRPCRGRVSRALPAH